MNKVLKKIFINTYYAENQKYTESVLNISKVEKSQYLIDNTVNCLTVSSKNLQGISKLILVSTLFALSDLTWAASGDYSTETIGSTCTTRCQSGHDSHRNDSSHASLQGLKVDKGGKGATGLQRLSAYDLAEKNGYKGYLGKWLGSLRVASGLSSHAAEEILVESTDRRVNELNHTLNHSEDSVYTAVESKIAIASLPQPTDVGYNMFSVSAGTWGGEQGYALGFSGVTENNKYVYKISTISKSENNLAAGVSVGWQWK